MRKQYFEPFTYHFTKIGSGQTYGILNNRPLYYRLFPSLVQSNAEDKQQPQHDDGDGNSGGSGGSEDNVDGSAADDASTHYRYGSGNGAVAGQSAVLDLAAAGGGGTSSTSSTRGYARLAAHEDDDDEEEEEEEEEEESNRTAVVGQQARP